MAIDIGPKISVDGEREFRESLKNIIAESKSLGSEMKALESSFDESTSAEEKMSKKSELLNRQIETQQKYVDKLKEGLQRTAEKYGEGSTEVYNYQDKLNKATSVLNGMKSELKNVESGVGDTSEAMAEASDESSRFSDNLKANLLSEAITRGFDALANAAKKVAGTMKDMVVSSAGYADEINTLSVTTGLSTDTLQEYQYMADLADVSLNTITGSLTKLTKQMGAAADGNETAAGKFAELGINIKDANGNLKTSEEVFNEAISALSEIENQTERDAASMELFGKSAQDLNPLMAIGAEGIAQLKQEAHDTGYVLDTEALGSLNSVQDAMDRWKNTTTTLSNEVGLRLAPYIEKAADALNKFFQNGGLDKIITAFEKLAPVIAGATAAMIAYKSAMGISSVIGTVTSFIQKLTTVEEGMTVAQNLLNAVMAANPFALVATVLAGLAAAFVTAYATSETFRNKVNAAFETVKNTVMGAWDSIKQKWDAAKSFFSDIAQNFQKTFTDLKNKALTWGSDIIDNIARGIRNAIGKVTSAVSSVASTIKSFLHFSEPDVGPLSNFNDWMPDMMKQMSEQIENGRNRVQNAVRNVASDIAVPVNGASIQNTTTNVGGFSINVYGSAGQSVSDLADEIGQRIAELARRRGDVFA